MPVRIEFFHFFSATVAFFFFDERISAIQNDFTTRE